MKPRELPSYKLPDDLSNKIKDENFELGGLDPSNLDFLKAESLGYKKVGDRLLVLVLAKSRPYAPRPGFDNMLYVIKNDGRASDISELSSDELQNILLMAEDIEDIYEEQTSADNPLELKVLSVNFHEDPLDKEVFGKKLHAQTLKDVHVHVAGFQKEDLESTKALKRSNVSKQEWRDVNDPFLEITNKLWQIPSLRERIMKNIILLQPLDESEFPAINFSFDASIFKSKQFSEDLRTLHVNFVHFYENLLSLFTDLKKQDITGMPELYSIEKMQKNVNEFFKDLQVEHQYSKYLQEYFLKLTKILLPGEVIKEIPGSTESKAVFLRSPAYTLTILRKNGKNTGNINLSPRLLSTGNMLASLNLHKSINDNPPDNWLNKKTITEIAIKNKFPKVIV